MFYKRHLFAKTLLIQFICALLFIKTIFFFKCFRSVRETRHTYFLICCFDSRQPSRYSRVFLIFRFIKNFCYKTYWRRFFDDDLNILLKILNKIDLKVFLLKLKTFACYMSFLVSIIADFFVFKVTALFINFF